MRLDIRVKQNRAAQEKNLKRIRALSPRGELGKMAQYAAIKTHAYMRSIVHVRSGALKSSLIILRPSASTFVVRISGTARGVGKSRPAVYGPVENARGGSHAFVDRTMREAVPQIAREAQDRFMKEII